MTQAATVNYYSYVTIRRCNTFLENAESVTFADEAEKKIYLLRCVLSEHIVIFI